MLYKDTLLDFSTNRIVLHPLPPRALDKMKQRKHSVTLNSVMLSANKKKIM